MTLKALNKTTQPTWYPYLIAGGAAAACGFWLFQPEVGAWPLLLVLAPWVVGLILFGSLFIRSPFDPPIILFMLTAGISVWSAFDRDAAWAKFWLLVGGVSLYYALTNWILVGNERSRSYLGWSFLILGAATGGYFLFTNDWTVYPTEIDFVDLVMKTAQPAIPGLGLESFHPNVIGGTLAMLFPFGLATLALSWKRQEIAGSLLAIALNFILLVGLALTSSRGAWIAVSLSIILLCWWYIAGRITSQQKRYHLLLFLGALCLILVCAVAVIFILPEVAGGILETMASTETGLKRADLYVNSLMLASDYPFIGAGLDNFMMLYSSYALLTHVGFSTHSHNIYLDVLIEQGVIALGALFWMWSLMAMAIWRNGAQREVNFSPKTIKGQKEKRGLQEASLLGETILLTAAGTSLLIFLLHGLVDDAIYNSRAVVLMFLPLAFGVPQLKRAPLLGRAPKLIFVGLVSMATVLVLSIWGRPMVSLLRSNWAAVQQSRIELSDYSWPEVPVQDAIRREVDLSAAINAYEGALAFNQMNPTANRRLGQVEISLGDYESALMHLNHAYAVTPWNNATRQILAEALIVNGHLAEGQSLWETVESEQDQKELRIFWYRYIGREDLLSAKTLNDLP